MKEAGPTTSPTCDWLIIGGGIHGVHIATRLLSDVGVSRQKLRIIDPGDRLLERWRTCTHTTGMKHLRSPSVHHLDLDPWALQRFAGSRKNRKRGLFAAPYDRPALGLFNDHCEEVISSLALSELHVKARALTCSVGCDGVTVGLSNGAELEARNVVMAIGASEQTEWPKWAPRGDSRVQHVFEPGFSGWPLSKEAIAVVGGGISAGQVALRLVKEGHEVHMVSRHGLRKRQFDSEPGWLGPKFMAGFTSERNIDRRRELIDEARHRGSVPPDIQRALRRAMKAEKLRWHEGETETLGNGGDGRLSMEVSTGAILEVDRVLLATGFASPRPGGSLVDQLVESESLPCASCGYPIVDESLRWHPRVYVSGPLAELELGPASRNIAGARRAADRLVKAARSEGFQTGASA